MRKKGAGAVSICNFQSFIDGMRSSDVAPEDRSRLQNPIIPASQFSIMRVRRVSCEICSHVLAQLIEARTRNLRCVANLNSETERPKIKYQQSAAHQRSPILVRNSQTAIPRTQCPHLDIAIHNHLYYPNDQ